MKLLNHTQTIIKFSLFIYIIFVVFPITLIPFDFRLPENIQIAWTTDTIDVITNILLFTPIGFLFSLNREIRTFSLFIRALCLGLLLSLIIECAQVFLPGRYTQPFDMLTNGLGAWFGAFLYNVLEKYLFKYRWIEKKKG